MRLRTNERSGLVRFDLGGTDKPVAGAGDGLDVPRLVPVVLKLCPQGAHMTVYDVALHHKVGAPERVEDLLSREDASSVGGEKVEECLLQRGQMQLVLTREHLAVEDIDLEVPDAQPRDELSVAAVGARITARC